MGKIPIIRPKRTQRDYPLSFKLSVIEQVEAGEFTYKQAQQHYGIQGKSTVLVWLRKHGKLNWCNPIENVMTKGKETPAQKIKRLEKELEDERAKTRLLNEVVDIMDNEHGASLRKKYLSKAPKNSQAKVQ